MAVVAPARHIVQRRPAVRRGKPEPRGVDAILACLSPIGWLSLLATAATFWIGIKPLFEAGAFAQQSTASILAQVGTAVADAALLALPAALEIGTPRIARRNRWLYRGAVLIAAADIARPILDAIRGFVLNALDPAAGGQVDPTSPLGLAFVVASMGIGVLSISGVWAFSDGLADAGARLRRFAVPAISLAVVTATVVAYADALTSNIDLATLIGWLNIIGFSLSLVLIGLYAAVAVRLMTGMAFRLVPLRAWVPAGIAGVVLLVYRAMAPFLAAGTPIEVSIAFRVMGLAIWPLLVVAALLGLGRGSRVRRVRSPLRQLYIVGPTA